MEALLVPARWAARLASGASWLDCAALALALLGLLYWLGTSTHSHFRRRGLPFARPVLPFLGNIAPLLLGLVPPTDYATELYRRFEGHRAFGLFQCLRPTLFLRDPDLIRQVTVKEFDHFTDHQDLFSEKVEPLFARNLFSLKGEAWRDMRATLSPAFTSSKMRSIFQLMNTCGKQAVNYLKQKVKNSPNGVYEAEMKDYFSRFANDIIATSAFGIECDSLSHPENEFYQRGRELTNTKGLKTFIFMGYALVPKVMETLRIPINSERVRKFFKNIVHDTIRERKHKNIFRPDMLQLLMQAQQGQLKADAEDEQENLLGAKIKKITDDDITAQAVLFFFAGFDTVSTALGFCAYALTKHQAVQEKVVQEVDEMFQNNKDDLTYEAVQGLKYMDMFINEVLRYYFGAPSLDRKCTKDFTIPAQGEAPAYTVRKGDEIWFPIYAIHHDPKYWDEPEVFNPERFSDENKHKIKPYTFMPFGVGPRICIGSRFALLEVKVALAHILRHFVFTPTPKTAKKVEYQFDFNGDMKGGYWVGITSRAH